MRRELPRDGVARSFLVTKEHTGIAEKWITDLLRKKIGYRGLSAPMISKWAVYSQPRRLSRRRSGYPRRG
jgi:hypothetical protein